jgi:hypothetical protein
VVGLYTCSIPPGKLYYEEAVLTLRHFKDNKGWKTQEREERRNENIFSLSLFKWNI